MNGKSVLRFRQAHMWFDLASAHEDDSYAEDYAGDFRDSLAEKMTPSQIARPSAWQENGSRKAMTRNVSDSSGVNWSVV